MTQKNNTMVYRWVIGTLITVIVVVFGLLVASAESVNSRQDERLDRVEARHVLIMDKLNEIAATQQVVLFRLQARDKEGMP